MPGEREQKPRRCSLRQREPGSVAPAAGVQRVGSKKGMKFVESEWEKQLKRRGEMLGIGVRTLFSGQWGAIEGF